MSVLSDVLSQKTQSQWLEIIKSKLNANGIPTDAWVSKTNTQLVFAQVMSEILSDLDLSLTQIAASQFLQYTSDGLKDFVGSSQYQIEPLPATATIIQVRLVSSASTPVYNIIADQLTLGTQGTDPSQVLLYKNITGGTLTTGGTLDLLYQAVLVGSKYNIPNTTILDLKTSLAGVVVSNPLNPVAPSCIINQGADEESLSQYTDRCKSRWGTKGAGGTEDAYRYWALQPINGGTTTPVRKIRVAPSLYQGKQWPGYCTVFVAGATGALTGAEINAVQANFDAPQRYPMGNKVFVTNAVQKNVLIQGTVFVYRKANVSLIDIQSAVEQSLQKYQNTLNIGDNGIYPSKILAWIFSRPITGANVDNNIAAIKTIDIVNPVAAVSLNYDEYPNLVYTGGNLQYVLAD
jgi:hypothetical protein